MIFVDTGAWFASVVPWDANHAAAVAWLGQNREILITTDYILDETLTLLRVRKEPDPLWPSENNYSPDDSVNCIFFKRRTCTRLGKSSEISQTRIGVSPTALPKLPWKTSA
jgi:hypothetical protein